MVLPSVCIQQKYCMFEKSLYEIKIESPSFKSRGEECRVVSDIPTISES